MLLSGFSATSMLRNLTLVNSQWTGEVVKQAYGIEPIVLYPPVPGDFSDVPWHDKENGFVCLGRFDPSKRIECIVAILAEVRKHVPDVHLHIIGTTASQDPAESRDYRQKIKELARANSSWVSLHQNLARHELTALLSRHRYGLHAHQTEHFGIAVAEMVSAGCITFVPDDGGQVEIVQDEALIYHDEPDAVRKIIAVLRNSDEQARLSTRLAQRKQALSNQKFVENIRDIVRQFEP